MLPVMVGNKKNIRATYHASDTMHVLAHKRKYGIVFHLAFYQRFAPLDEAGGLIQLYGQELNKALVLRVKRRC